jgi:hypothetical protein
MMMYAFAATPKALRRVCHRVADASAPDCEVVVDVCGVCHRPMWLIVGAPPLAGIVCTRCVAEEIAHEAAQAAD